MTDEVRLCVTPLEEDTKMEIRLVVSNGGEAEINEYKAVIKKKWLSIGDMVVLNLQQYTEDGKV